MLSIHFSPTDFTFIFSNIIFSAHITMLLYNESEMVLLRFSSNQTIESIVPEVIVLKLCTVEFTLF